VADAASTIFVMYGARDAIAGGLRHIEQQVEGIERAVFENPSLAFDLAKTLVESACRTLLKERSIVFGENDDLPKLFKTVTQNLPFLPPTSSSEAEARNSLKRTLGGLSTAIQGICELRNRCGFASHGAGASRPAMETVQALLAAQAADAIVGFLCRVHRQDQTHPASKQPLFDDNADFNEHVDEAHGTIRIFELEFRPSEVLFQMEPESYRVYLAEFRGENTEGGDDANGGGEGAP